jgi:uncharacterized protein (DUF1697 family)
MVALLSFKLEGRLKNQPLPRKNMNKKIIFKPINKETKITAFIRKNFGDNKSIIIETNSNLEKNLVANKIQFENQTIIIREHNDNHFCYKILNKNINNANHPARQKAIKIIEQVIEPFFKTSISHERYYKLEDQLTNIINQ